MTSRPPNPAPGSTSARMLALAGLAAALLFWFPAVPAAQAPVGVPAPAGQDAPAATFDEWLVGLRKDALARGISQPTIDAALGHIEPLRVVVERDRTQAEVTLTLDQYVKRRLTKKFVSTARDVARQNAALLRRVTAQYGVAGPVVVAIWGLESNFGRFAGTWPTIPALATLAYDAHRPAMFREELFAALEIVDREKIDPATLKGSWAGAMGQPQFMPSSFLRYAADFDGDGKPDIWGSKGDVFASIANYLKEHGWTPGVGWGREVRLDDATAQRVAGKVPLRVTGGCQAIRQMTEPRPIEDWRKLGVRALDGKPLAGKAPDSSLVRIDRHAFLAYGNYEALLGYNCAHAYALSVGMLADRIGKN